MQKYVANNINKEDIINDQRYLKLLSREFPTIQLASTEIINLEAILNLPKGTEHFLSDVHGEYEAFLHILKNGSGVIRRKIDDIFGSTITNKEKNKFATIIYYPNEMLELQRRKDDELYDWYQMILHRLVLVCREVSSKYTRSKVRKALPENFDFIIEELLHEKENEPNKNLYYDQIIKTIVEIGRAKEFIIAISEVIQRLSIDHLHIIGDIYDRGPGAHIIIDKLINYHKIDIQWGNHDLIWMGAASGSLIAIANVIRISARYDNLHALDEAYGINLMPLATFAMETYPNIDNSFYPKVEKEEMTKELDVTTQIHMAITIIMFKLEGQFIKRNPHYNMEDRLLLDMIDYKNLTIKIDNKTYKLHTNGFPTINPNDPYKLTQQEVEVIRKLKKSFLNNEKLQMHVSFLFSKGNIYKVFNNNLLFHGCIPMDDDGSYLDLKIDEKMYKGKELLDKFEKTIREIYGTKDEIRDEKKSDIFWYLWAGDKSSLFGKSRMKTFERYYIKDKETHIEKRNHYYKYILQEEYCKGILQEFGLNNEHSKIINGHVPVKVSKGESPIKSGGKLIVIDGGLSKAYQGVTGIAGYTLIYNSHGMMLASHQPFNSKRESILKNEDINSSLQHVYLTNERITVKQTDIGKKLEQDICDLKKLLKAYQIGVIKEKY